jgi:hypothetical protein
MDRESLIVQLAASQELEWRSSRQRQRSGSPSRAILTWTPAATLIVKLGTPALSLGLSSTGRWLLFSRGEGTVFDFDTAQYYLWLFPLLEMSHRDANEAIISELKKHALDEAWIEYFPFQQIVAAALESDSKYWPDLALDWVPSVAPSPLIVAALQVLGQQGRTQQHRHRAKKLLAQIST